MPTKERYERDKDYAEMAGYAPSEIGYAKVIVKDCNVVGVSKIVV